MSLPVPAVIEQLLSAVSDIKLIRFCSLAAAVVIAWDHATTFDQEMQYIWPARWSLGKVLFLINRYYTLAAAIVNNYVLLTPSLTDTVCLHFFRWQAATGIISVVVAQITLQLRIYAIYSLDKRVLYGVFGTFVIAMVSAIAIHIAAFWNATATSTAVPGLPFCVPVGLPAHYWAVWIPILSFEILLLGLALHKAVTGSLDDVLETSTPTQRSPWRRRAQRPWESTKRVASVFARAERIVDILIRDSILYFLTMFAAYFANLLVWYFGTVNTMDLPIAFSDAFSCVMCSHMLLNVHARPRGDGVDLGLALSVLQSQTAPADAFELPRIMSTGSHFRGNDSIKQPGLEDDLSYVEGGLSIAPRDAQRLRRMTTGQT